MVVLCVLVLSLVVTAVDGKYFIRSRRVSQYDSASLQFVNALRVCDDGSNLPAALATANGRFYSACAHEENVLHVFDTITFNRLADIPLGDQTPQSSPVLDLAPSDATNSVYILLDTLNQNVLKVNLTDSSVSRWKQINFQPPQLSAAGSTGNVLMISSTNTLMVYSPAGDVITNVSLSNGIVRPTEAFETVAGTYLISQDSTVANPNVLFEIDVTGKIIASYSGVITPAPGDNATWAVANPTCLMQDLLGQLFLVDLQKSLVVAVSADLTKGRVLLRPGTGDSNKVVYKYMRGAVYDRESKLLFVSHYGDPSDSVISVFKVNFGTTRKRYFFS